jgi:hypothetical protein
MFPVVTFALSSSLRASLSSNVSEAFHRFPQSFCQHLVELLDVSPTFLQPEISELAFEGTSLSACLQPESL